MSALANIRVGRITVRHEYRVYGPSPYGGEWDTEWRWRNHEAAHAYARKMVSHESVPHAYVEHRSVEMEILDVEFVEPANGVVAA